MTKQRSRFSVFSDDEWARIEPLLPSNAGRKGHPFGDNRRVVEGILNRYRTGIPWRDLPRELYGPWRSPARHQHQAARSGHGGLIEPQESAVRGV